MNKFGQKIRDCGRPRISSARSGAAMASVRHWAVPAVMAAALILSGCQTLNPDSAEGESNSLLKALAIAFVGGAAYWGSTGGGSSDDSPLLRTPPEEPNRLAGAFSEAVLENGQYSITTPLLNAPAGVGGFEIEILIPSDFDLALGTGTCETPSGSVRRCDVTIERGLRFQRLLLVPESTTPPVADDPPPLVSLIPSNNYDIQRVLTFREPVMQGADARGEASFTVLANVRPSTGDRFVLRFRVEGLAAGDFRRVDGGVPCNGVICEVTIQDDETSGTLGIEPTTPNPNMEWRLILVPDDNDNYDIQPTVGFFIGDDLLDAPTVEQGSVTQSGRATFTIFSNTPAPAGGLDVRVNIAREGFGFDESDAGQLAAIAAIVGSQANHIPCDGSICTVRIPPGDISVSFTLIPQGLANPDTDAEFDYRWEVSLVPDDDDPFEIESESVDTPVLVENTPTGVRGGFSQPLITNARLRQISVQTPVLDRAAGLGGFTVAFTLSLNIRPVADQTVMVDGVEMPLTVTCNGVACTVTIPSGAGLQPLEIQLESVLVADVTDTTEPGFVDDNLEFGAPVVTDEMTGEVSIVPPTLAIAAPADRRIRFTIADGFEPVPPADNPAQTAMVSCDSANPTACTVTILMSETSTAPLLFRPVAISRTNPLDPDSVAINLPNDNTDVNILPPPPTVPPVVSFDTPEPTVAPENGNATFTVGSNVRVPPEGFAVSFRIEGDAFTAMHPDGTELDCPQNVCTVTIQFGFRTAAFILVPTGPRPPDSDLFTRWTVAIVDDPDNIYGIDGNNRVAVVDIELLTLIADGEADFTLDRNAPVRFGRLSTSFDAFGRDGALPDVLEIPSAPRVLADSGANPFASGYGYFADDGGFLPVESQGVTGDILTDDTLALPPPNLGIVDQISGQVDITLPLLDAPAGPGGFDIEFTVSGSNDFTATLLDAVDPADRTSVQCPGNICTVTIPEGETGLPSSGNRVVLTPTVPPSVLNNIPAPNWMVMINTMDPILPDPLSVNRANNDEAVFYARRGNQLVARFQTTGTFTDTAQVETITFGPFSGTDSLPDFERVPFDPDPFNFGPPGTVEASCNNLAQSSPERLDCFDALARHENRQNRLQGFHTSFGADFNTFLEQVCARAEDSSMCDDSFSNANELNLLVVDGFGGIGPLYRGDLALSEGEDVDINRPVAIALAITSTLIATANDVQDLGYSYSVDTDSNGIDLDAAGNPVNAFASLGSVDFALYQSGDIPNPLPPSDAFSISQIDPSRELLGASNVRTFLFENEFSAIGAWLIPPTAEEVNADAEAPYYAAAAHWFGFETPADRIPTMDEAVYGGIAIGDFRQVTFDNAGEFAGKSSYYVRGNAQFDANFGTGEMNGQFDLFAYDPRDVYGDPSQLLSQPLDLLVVNWEGQILPDSGAFANNFDRVLEPRVDAMGNIIYRTDPDSGAILRDPDTNLQLPETREVFAPAGTLQQPLRATVEDRDGNPIPQAARIPVFDNLVQVGVDNPFIGIGGADPSLPAPIGSDALFSVFGKFFGPNAEEVAGELRLFNSRFFQLTPPDFDGNGVPVPNTGTSESVTSSLEVHFTADGGDVPDDRFEESP